jgi:GNAT superfamily N-acetyltransferase
MGEPVDWLCDDAEGFADLFSAYYTDSDSECAWVADIGDRTVGYLLGSARPVDPASMWRHALPALTRASAWTSLRAASFYGRMGLDLTLGRSGQPPVDAAAYPAHLHLNLLPHARGKGVGAMMMRAFEGYVMQLGIPGVHLQAFEEHTSAHAFFSSFGFEHHGEAVGAAGFRNRDGTPLTVRTMVKSLVR